MHNRVFIASFLQPCLISLLLFFFFSVCVVWALFLWSLVFHHASFFFQDHYSSHSLFLVSPFCNTWMSVFSVTSGTRRLHCPAGILAQEGLSHLYHCLAPRLLASHFIPVSQSQFALFFQLYLLWEIYLSLIDHDVEIPITSGWWCCISSIKKNPTMLFSVKCQSVPFL